MIRLNVMVFFAFLLVSCGGGGSFESEYDSPMASDGSGGTSVDSSADSNMDSGPDWVEGDYGKWIDGYEAQCENPRTSSEYSDSSGSSVLENFWIRAYSFDTYLWYQDLIDIDPKAEEEVLDSELRAKGRSDSWLNDQSLTRKYFDLMKTFELSPSGNPKDKYHFTYDTERWKKLSEGGVSAGYGMEFYRISDSRPRKWLIAYTEPDTPASVSGVVRGLDIVSIDGVDFREGTDADTLNAGLFPETVGEVHTFVFRNVETEDTFSVDLESQEITSTPVQSVKIFENSKAKVGYLVFNDHIATSEPLLIEAIETFKVSNVSELILDMRYNGGGFLDIARTLASMVAGDAAVGKIFSEYEFNNKYPNRNPITGSSLSPSRYISASTGRFLVSSGTQLPMLNLNRVVVISGSGTCSASEAVINGLRGVGVEVILIGDTTCGKPYGFYGIDNCGTTYFTIQFKGVNAVGYGDYTDGFSPPGSKYLGEPLPGCFIGDDLSKELGDSEEARLSASLQYLETGRCPSESSAQKRVHYSIRSTGEGYVVKSLPQGMLLRR